MTYNYKQAKFYTTVNDLKSLPQVNHEVAIVGRSNAGKSSLLNTLTNQNRLAYTSKTPGRTQHINYFEVSSGVYLVDLPGYGYAKVPEKIRDHWVHLLGDYLQFRAEIVGLVLIMDARHPLKDLDLQMIEFISHSGKPLHVVLSKADKLSNQERTNTLRLVQKKIAEYGFINLSVQLFSSLKKTGVPELEDKLNEWLT
ncbi:MAG: ribosome biogenesis GTP-binding protein YihA/YsxC [Burkholderiales bacterium]|nr:ribosome biogenesis GTP-binding protein YihA/YsxC [Burkholderiales bacterium]